MIEGAEMKSHDGFAVTVGAMVSTISAEDVRQALVGALSALLVYALKRLIEKIWPPENNP